MHTIENNPHFQIFIQKNSKITFIKTQKSVINFKKQKLYYFFTDHTVINLKISYEYFKVQR